MAARQIELACDVIDRLELHRRCLDEAVADAYAELAALLVRHQEQAATPTAGAGGAGLALTPGRLTRQRFTPRRPSAR